MRWKLRKLVLQFLNIIVISVLFSSCGTYVVVHSWGLRDYNVTMGSFDGKSFEYSRRAYNFMGPLNKDFVSIEKVFDEEEVHKKYVGGFEVITSHQLADVLLSLIPFFSTRTVEIVGRIRTRKKDWY